MKGFKKDGKFRPTSKRNKSALKVADIPKHKMKISEDVEYQERAEWDWLNRKK